MIKKSILPARRAEILRLLDDIEESHGITIVHAIESGSRAWGFPSHDSDYDIRFIYHHPLEWYITAFEKKDHIELPISGDLDPGGWDIGKCLRLLHKGNAVLHEWLNSPAVYRTSEKVNPLLSLSHDVFYPPAAYYHYLSLAKKKLADSGMANNAKVFLYGLRALLCAKWVSEKGKAPPVLFDTLVNTYFDSSLSDALARVLEQKLTTSENGEATIPEILLCFSSELFEALSKITVCGQKPDFSRKYDDVLRDIITAV